MTGRESDGEQDELRDEGGGRAGDRCDGRDGGRGARDGWRRSYRRRGGGHGSESASLGVSNRVVVHDETRDGEDNIVLAVGLVVGLGDNEHVECEDLAAYLDEGRGEGGVVGHGVERTFVSVGAGADVVAHAVGDDARGVATVLAVGLTVVEGGVSVMRSLLEVRAVRRMIFVSSVRMRTRCASVCEGSCMAERIGWPSTGEVWGRSSGACAGAVSAGGRLGMACAAAASAGGRLGMGEVAGRVGW